MFRRIMVFGLPGCGKSNFCDKLAKLTNLPLIHLDKIYFNPGWIAKDREIFRRELSKIVDNKEWIIDGNCMRSLEVRYQKAEVALFFNFKLSTCFYRVIRRVFIHDKHLRDLPEGCKKSVRYPLLRYLIAFRRRYTKDIEDLQEKYPRVEFVEIKSDLDAQKFLDEIAKLAKKEKGCLS